MNSHNLYPQTVPIQEMALKPNQPETIWPDTALAGVEECRDKFGIGFNAELRAVIDLSPGENGAANSLYVFDKGEEPSIGIIADVGDAPTRLVPRNDRYVVITNNGLDMIRNSVDNGWSPSSRGWKSIEAGSLITFGRKAETLNDEFSREVSGGHLDIEFGQDGTLRVTDNNSTNGTRLISSNIAPPEIEQEPTETSTGEFMLGDIPGRYIGATDMGGRGNGYIFETLGDDGKERRLLVYKSNSEGGWRATQGEDSEGIILKGGDNARVRSHYTQETQLHPALEGIIEQLEDRNEQPSIGRENIPVLSPQGEFEAERDFVKQVSLTPAPDKKLYEAIADIRPGQLSYERFAFRNGIKQSKSPEKLTEIFMNKMQKANEVLRSSGFRPNFDDHISTKSGEHKILGTITKETYGSVVNGRKYEWTFAYTKDKKVWIDRIRLGDAKPSAYGTDSEVVDSAILTSKPIEYAQQCEVIPDSMKKPTGHGSYVDITDFLKGLYPIQQFIEHKSKAV